MTDQNGKIKIQIGKGVRFYNLPKEAKEKIIKDLTFENQKYINAMKHGGYLYSTIPRYITFFIKSKDESVFWTPRGYLWFMRKWLKQNGYQSIIDDRTLTLPKLNISFKGELRKYQNEGVELMYKRYPIGVLEAPTGGGKTVIGIGLISKIKQPTLIIVHTKELLYQWKSAIKKFLDFDCGLIGDGKYEIKPISVGIINTVQKNTQDLVNKFGMILVDECLTPDTEILTENGWKLIKNLSKKDKVAQWNTSGQISFVHPIKRIKKEFKGKLVHLKSREFDLMMTPNHQHPYISIKKNGEYLHHKKEIKDININSHYFFPLNGNTFGKIMFTDWHRFQIMVQADGHLTKYKNRIDFIFRKQRKIERFLELIKKLKIPYKEVNQKGGKCRRFMVWPQIKISKKLGDIIQLKDISSTFVDAFIQELVQWDGSIKNGNLYYSTTDNENADWVQSLCVLGGWKCSRRIQIDNRKKQYKNVHRFLFWKKTYQTTQSIKKTNVPYNGMVYCVRVPSGNIIVRRNNKVAITGNCHRVAANTWIETLQEFPAKYYLGLSISKNSIVSVKINNQIITTEIQNLFTGKKNLYHPKNMHVRSCDNGIFKWIKVESLFRHKLQNKKMFRIITTSGRSIDMTEDHSAIIVENKKLKEKRPEELKNGDFFLIDSAKQEDIKTNDTIKITKILQNFDNMMISGCSNNQIEKYAQTFNSNIRHKIRYRHKHGKFGKYIPLKFYIEQNYSFNGFVYFSGKGNGYSSKINLNDIAKIAGYYAGNGSSKNGRVSLVCPRKKYKTVLKELEKLNLNVKKRDKGTSIELTFSHGILQKILSEITKGKAHNKKINSCIFSASEKVKRKYLSGIIFSDGHIGKKDRIYISTSSRHLAYGIDRLCASLGIYTSISIRKAKKGGTINGRQIIGRYDNYIVNFSMNAYKNKNKGYNGKRNVKQINTNGSILKIKEIKQIEYNKNDYVYDFCVPETQNFVANGIVCHNTATAFRKDGLGKAIFAHIGPKLHTVDKTKLHDIGAVLKPQIILVPTDFNIKSYFGRTQLPYATVIKKLTEDYDRNSLICNVIYKDFKRFNQNILIVSDRVSHCYELSRILSLQHIHSSVLSGKTSNKKRKEIVDQVKSGQCRILFATLSLIGEGFDAPNLTALLLTTPIKFSGRLIQTVGRILRPEKNKVPRVYDFRDDNVSMLRYSGIARNKIYKKQWG